METLSSLALGFSVALSPENLIWCFVGVTVGTFIGALPGLGALAAISMLFPLTYHLDATTSLVMLSGVYYGTQYGGSISSILLRLPGGPSSAIVCLDGNEMAKQGRAGSALALTAIGSFVGSVFGIVLVIAFAPWLAKLAISFSSAEYFSMMLLGLVAASMLARGSPLKGLIMVFAGVVCGIVGADTQTGTARFMFGFAELYDGINMVVIAMGLFGVAEVINSIAKMSGLPSNIAPVSFRSLFPDREDRRRSVMPMVRGTAVGALLGPLPGVGGTICSFLTYAMEKRVSKNPREFGRGAVEGVVGPETANNAGAITSFVPLLTLGIPGDAVMALMLGAFLVNDITPGPLLISTNPDLFWGLIASFIVGNLMLLVLNLPLVGIWVSMLKIPYHLLYPGILLLTAVGVYAIQASVFDVYLLIVSGIVGYLFIILGFEAAPFLMGFILGPLLETHLRRAMLLANGDASVFIERPVSAGILAAILVVLAIVAWGAWHGRRMPERGVAAMTPEAVPAEEGRSRSTFAS